MMVVPSLGVERVTGVRRLGDPEPIVVDCGHCMGGDFDVETWPSLSGLVTARTAWT